MSDPKSQEVTLAELEEELWDLLRDKEYAAAADILRSMRVASVERLLDRTPPGLMPVAFRLLDKDVAVEVFGNMEPSLQSDLIDGLADEHTRDLFSQLQSSTQARLVDEVPAEVAQRLLASLGQAERAAAAKVLGYPEDSVGRRMSVVPQELAPDMSAATALNIILRCDCARRRGGQPDGTTVGSSTHKVLGLVHLPRLVRAEPDELIEDIMEPTGNGVGACRRRRYRSYSSSTTASKHSGGRRRRAPDRNAHGCRRTADSGRRRIRRYLPPGGAEPLGQPYLSTSIMQLVKSRIVWLLVLGIGAVLTVQVLDYFEDTLAAMVADTVCPVADRHRW